jgi:hypothetical protein
MIFDGLNKHGGRFRDNKIWFQRLLLLLFPNVVVNVALGVVTVLLVQYILVVILT